ncbi:patatin-like protein [Pontixanthobacter aquaemixtae]|uniref:Patatin-like protein n=1 Tax=Pontixanthobacter aquaemixtae TaxID=1958940 RepID=A0A844ZQZ7_9SPHN|nr:patatin-like protein [Pontixanthobacter aquaemixtae]MXO90243.1 patatin-like protein [Pontixanthobacter aquaemixtae]
MRQKELRIALVCYGGVSLAVYMHGVTKEIWKLARASRAFHSFEPRAEGVQGVYRDLFHAIEKEQGLTLRVLPDILTGASAGGINAVFLAQAIHSGQSLEPLTDLWLEMADVDQLVDPDARPMWRFAKFWAQPFASWILKRPGNAVSESVAPETRAEVRRKVSHLVRGRWFEPPFSGPGFSKLLFNALKAMEKAPLEQPLLPAGHPVDLLVTATDFRGHLELLRLNSPPIVEESEHRMPVSFACKTPDKPGANLSNLLELTLAARATASFPGAFPPLKLDEIDSLAEWAGADWSTREQFLQRIMPVHMREGETANVSLIDGSVLVNAPFGGAMDALKGRPAQREVDRRFVYIDPRPDRFGVQKEHEGKPVGFFAAIFGSLSTIPREQPIRDNLEQLEQQSRDAEALRRMVAGLRHEVERAVEKLFGRTLFLNKPTPKRLVGWRGKAQQAAAESAGFAYNSYAQAKFAGIVEKLAELTFAAAPGAGLPDSSPIAASFFAELERRGMASLSDEAGGASAEAIAFFRAHDLGFRIRRLRLLARRLARDWEADPDIPDDALEAARKAIYKILALYFAQEKREALGEDFTGLAQNALRQPGPVLDYLAARRLLPEIDEQAEIMLADAMQDMPKDLRRRMLLTYLGFPFYDIATLPLMRTEGLTEYDPIKVDRISPDDARSIREGGTRATLRGTEFYNFGAFFSRAYRENDYLWGRLHGAERMIDLVCSTADRPLEDGECARFKRQAFLAILDEEKDRLTTDSGLVDRIRAEVLERLGQGA